MTIFIIKYKDSLLRLFVNSNFNCNIHFSSSSRCYFKDEEKRKIIERLKRIKIPQYKGSSKSKENAAVLVPLCNVHNQMSLLYTLRKHDLKTHKGQVSFPGGKSNAMDSSLVSTALRETEEELGILPSNVDVWGHGNVISARDFNILPVVGYLGNTDITKLKPHPSEVECVFTIPLTHFYLKNNCRYTRFRSGQEHGYILPVYLNEKHNIWGITALITYMFLKSLSPKDYDHDLNFIKPVSNVSSG